MRKLLLLTAGGAVGYVLGAKAGTERYESLKAKAVSAKERSPELVHKARELRSKGEAIAQDISMPATSSESTTSVGGAKPAIDVTGGSTKSASKSAN